MSKEFSSVLVGLYDEKLEEYLNVTSFSNEDCAKRSFCDLCSRDQAIQRHPEDYRMDLLGNFNPSSGVIVPCPVHVLVDAKAVIGGNDDK